MWYENNEQTLKGDGVRQGSCVANYVAPGLIPYLFIFIQLSEKTISEAIESEMSGDVQKGMLAIGKNN